MEFLFEYGLFLAKAITVVIGILIVFSSIVNLRQQKSALSHGHIEITNLNEYYDDLEYSLVESTFDKAQRKAWQKAKKAKEKEHKKDETPSKRLYCFRFDGDMHASEEKNLKEIINAILTVATPQDEVLAILESEGGLVHAYGLAASQLERIKKANIPLIAAVDRVAASGGYMMACIADKIIAAPFAVLGSIGVMAELPNFHRLLKKFDIDYEQHTAGEFKRTLTVFGQNTEKAREKFQEELEETHHLFKKHVGVHRPSLNLDKVATGEHWYGHDALELSLVDEIATSDEYLQAHRHERELYEIEYVERHPIGDRLASFLHANIKKLKAAIFSGV